jgi:mRNA interferase MazF
MISCDSGASGTKWDQKTRNYQQSSFLWAAAVYIAKGGARTIMQNEQEFYRGEIYYADLDQTVGHEQYGTRPVLIIQNDMGNRYSPNVIVAVASKRVSKKKRQPTHVSLDKIAGLPRKSQFQLETIYTVDKERLRERVGKLTKEQMRQINAALCASLGLRKKNYIPMEVKAQ